MTPQELTQLCHQAASTLEFSAQRAALTLALEAISQWQELAPFQRAQFTGRVSQALETLNRRQRDPGVLLEALRRTLESESLDLANVAPLSEWFERVAYESDEALRGELLPVDLLHAYREVCRRTPGFHSAERLARWRRERRLERVTGFAATSPDPRQDLTAACGLESLLRGLPESDDALADWLAPLAQARQLAEQRLAIPDADLLANCLSSYQEQLLATGENRLAQDDSYLLGKNLEALRPRLAAAAIPSEQVASHLEQLEELERRFDQVRYRSSSYVFQSQYLPILRNLRHEAEQTGNFPGFLARWREVRTASRQGTWGVDRLARYHQERVWEELSSIRTILDERRCSPTAWQQALRGVAELVDDLERRAVIGRPMLAAVERRLREVSDWAHSLTRSRPAINDATSPSPERSEPPSLDGLADLEDRCRELRRVLPERQEAFIRQLHEQLAAFVSQLDDRMNFAAAYDELRDVEQTIFDRQNWLPRGAHRALADQFRDARRQFWQRLGNRQAIEAGFRTLDERLETAARRLRHSCQAEELELELEQLAFRVAHGRFSDGHWRALSQLVRRMHQRIAGLRRKRAEYLAARASSQAALYAELSALVCECQANASREPGSPASWEALIDADRQVRAARELTREQEHSLRTQLDAAFHCIREQRAAFARTASVVYAAYLDDINNVLQPLEATCPAPTREDAFLAIEGIKPLRARLAQEGRLLRRQRQDLFEQLRIVSDAISQILNPSAEMQQQSTAALRRQIDELAAAIESLRDPSELPEFIGAHKRLYAEIRGTTLPIQIRSDLRHELEHLWSRIVEQKQTLGSGRFEIANIDATMSRLERQGTFLWIDRIPALI